MSEVTTAKDHEMIKAFLLDRLNESFDKRIRIRRPECRDFYFLLSGGELLVERFRKLCISVMQQQFAWKLFLFDVILERIRLLENPCFIGIVRARCDEDTSRFDVQKCNGEQITEASLRNNLF